MLIVHVIDYAPIMLGIVMTHVFISRKNNLYYAEILLKYEFG